MSTTLAPERATDGDEATPSEPRRALPPRAATERAPDTGEGACESQPSSRECKCDGGDAEACLEVANAAFQRGDHDVAIIRAYSLCQQGTPEACFRAAYYMKKLRIEQRFGTSADELRDKGVAAYEDGCGKDDAPACFGYGKLLFTGKYATADVATGKQHLETSCTAGHAPACSFLASAYETGAGGLKKDGQRALQLLEDACKAGGVASCTIVGDKVVRSDEKRAQALYDQACNGDDGSGCARVGGLHVQAGNHEEALEAFTKACELEHHASCVDAGALIETGRGTEKDAAKARELYNVACDEEIGAGCLSLADLMVKGLGGKRDWGQAVELSRRACSLGLAQGCKGAARLERNPPDWRCTTEADCQALCSERIGKACTALGDLEATEATTTVLAEHGWGEPDCRDAVDAYETGCTHGDGAACLRAGKYEDACKLGEADGCVLDDYTRHEAEEAREQKKILRRLERRCTRGSHLACIQLSELIDDQRQIGRLLGRSCKRGSGEACRALAYRSGLRLSSGGTCCSNAQEIAEQKRESAEMEAQAKKGRDLLRKACDLGDLEACGWAHSDYADEWWTPKVAETMRARARELLEVESCGRGARSLAIEARY